MPMEIINPISYRKWNDLILEGHRGAFFNSANWARVLAESYGYEPIYFSIVERGRLSAMIPVMGIRSILTGRRGVSLPFTDYCEPIFLDDGYRKLSMEFVKEYGKRRGWRYIEFRGNDYIADDMTCFNSYVGHTLDLCADEDELLSGMRSCMRKNIGKALRMGAKAEISTSLESLGEFYRLHCVTRKRHGLPPQPFHFFGKIHEHMIEKGLGMVILASYGDRYVAGGVFFQFGESAIHKYTALDMRFQEMRPVNLIIWEAIRHYAKSGYKTLCMGRTDQDATGLRWFKTAWGAKEHVIRYFRYDPKSGSYAGPSSPMSKRLCVVFNGMPLPLLKVAGKLLYRHVG